MGATPIAGVIWLDQVETLGAGSVSSPTWPDDLLEDEEIKAFSNSVIDIIDQALDDIFDIKEADERLRESLQGDLKADAFDRIVDRLGDILNACS